MLTDLNFYAKIISILGKNKYTLPFIFLAFFINSLLEILGLGLIGPYISLLIDTSESLPKYLSYFTEYLKIDVDRSKAILITSTLLGLIYFFKISFSLFILFLVSSFANNIIAFLRLEILLSFFEKPYLDKTKKNSAKDVQNLLVLSKSFSSQVIRPLLQLVSDILISLGIIAFLIITIGHKFYFVVLYFIFALLLYFFLFQNLQKKFGKAVNKASDSSVQVLNESIVGFKQIKILGIEPFFKKRLEKASYIFAKNSVLSQFLITAPKFLFEFLAVLGVILFVLIYYSESSSNELISTIGIIAFASLRLIPCLTSISRSLMQINFNINTIERLYISTWRLSQGNTHILTNDYYRDTPFKNLKISNLNFSFSDDDEPLIKNLSLNIKKGDIIGLSGKSGSGKSTLLDLIMGLLPPSSGSIVFNGKPIQETIRDAYSTLMYIPQEPFIIDGTIKENIILGENPLKIDTLRVNKAVEISNLQTLIKSLPDGIDSQVGENGNRLSGGQRQRIQIARAIYMRRNFLVFDEATSALDIQTEEEILEELVKLREEFTILMVSHRSNLQKYCTKFFVLEKGQLNQKDIN